MVTRTRIRKPFILCLLLMIALVSASLSAAEQKTIFYNVTTEEVWPAGMALGQADAALKNGYKVIIFLNVRGVYLASKHFESDTWGDSGKTLQDMLKSAMDQGAKAIMCPMCMKKAGITMDDVIKGVVKGGPDVTMKAMTADDTVVISY